MILGEAFYRRAVQKVADHLNEKDQHAALILHPDNVRYLTGIPMLQTDRPAGICIWKSGDTALFVPQLEADRATGWWVRDIRWYAEHPAEENPVRWMAREAGGPLLVDNIDHATWSEIGEEVEETTLTRVVEDLRSCKSSTEVDLIQQAAGFADQALERTFARLTSGVAERDLAADVSHRIESEIIEELGDRMRDIVPSVSGRVVSGTHAAWPAADTSTRPINRGDIVIAEYTVSIGGYHAVSGTTFFLGDPLRDIVSSVNACIRAQETLRRALRPGRTVEDVHQEVRRALERDGLGSAIKHRPGAGIGLSRYEAPWIVRGSTEEIRSGMVVVNHPGVYLTGRTGIRHAETVLVEDNGSRVLNPGIRRWDNPEVRLKEF